MLQKEQKGDAVTPVHAVSFGVRDFVPKMSSSGGHTVLFECIDISTLSISHFISLTDLALIKSYPCSSCNHGHFSQYAPVSH